MWSQITFLVRNVLDRIELEREEGQALVEYTLILALIAIVAIASLTTLGTDIASALGSVATSITKAV